ncbi:MAG: DUF6768 family protein [Planctomycetota bacterium]|jgi:hypothetical protein
MSDHIDHTIKAALDRDEIPDSELHITEESLLSQVMMSFRTQNKFLVAWVFIVMFAMMALVIWGFVEFFSTSDASERLAWALMILLPWGGISMLKIWYYMQLDKYSIMREVKRLELQIAQMRKERGG